MSGSLSSGSSGPRPTISSTMSSTSASSSVTLIAMRSSRVFSETNSWTCRRISSLGRRSSATRLISSSSMRWMRMRASSTRLLVFCAARFPAPAPRPSCGHWGSTRRDCRRRGCSAGCARSVGAFLERRKAAVHDAFLNRPLPNENSERDFCAVASTSSGRMIFFRSLIDIGVGVDLLQRHAAVDRLAHQPVVVGNAAGEMVAEDFLDVGLLDAVFEGRAARSG